jgi:hypothetical protein
MSSSISSILILAEQAAYTTLELIGYYSSLLTSFYHDTGSKQAHQSPKTTIKKMLRLGGKHRQCKLLPLLQA